VALGVHWPFLAVRPVWPTLSTRKEHAPSCEPSTPSWNASRPRASSTYSGSPAARTSRPTTPSTTPASVTCSADAMMDSVPTVFLTGQVRTELIGTDGFQEADISGITMPIVKHSILIQDPRDIPKAIHEAFHVASTGRPGPVLVDLPQDLSRADIPYEPVTGVHLPGYQPTTDGNAKQIRLAAKALANARRPVIYGGGGVVNPDAWAG